MVRLYSVLRVSAIDSTLQIAFLQTVLLHQ